ncbi:galactose-specific lectin nattectin-like [Pagrus major]|uniref:galactose-specific lectin nattectin-like n=1 Tax=Pagrus major TaxID=143350 RepID=UPI003CC8C4F0
MASALPLIVLLCLTVGLLNVSTAKAQLNCIRLGGNLASIHNDGENLVVRGMIKRACGSYVFAWIGLSDAIQEGKWLWTDGSRLVFTRWLRGQPDNHLGKEHCAHINFKDGGVIGVQAALYGRADRETCSEGRPPQQLTNTKCSQQGTVDVLRRR